MTAPIHTTDRKGRPYLRVTTTERSLWAVFLGESDTPIGMVRRYSVLNRQGETKNELLLASPKDIAKEQPAQIDQKYGWLEVTK